MSAASSPTLKWPALEELAATLASLPVAELPRLLGQLRELEATALARMCAAPGTTEASREPEQLLGVEEAAKRLNVSQDYLYRHWRKLPFAQKYDWGLRFNESALNAYIKNSRR